MSLQSLELVQQRDSLAPALAAARGHRLQLGLAGLAQRITRATIARLCSSGRGESTSMDLVAACGSIA